MLKQWFAAFALLILFVLIPISSSVAEPELLTVPHVIRPGKQYEIILYTPQSDILTSLDLIDTNNALVYTIASDLPLSTGENILEWDGLRANHSVPQQDDYFLRLTLQSGIELSSPLRIGAPYPLLLDVKQSTAIVNEAISLDVSFWLSESGTLNVQLDSPFVEGVPLQLATIAMSAGANNFYWHGLVDNVPLPNGQYTLLLTLHAANDTSSIPQSVVVDVQMQQFVNSQESPDIHEENVPTSSPEIEIISTPEPSPTLPPSSPPYSSLYDNTFWSMTPGETDDAIIWDILTQPITVYDGGLKAAPKAHAYMMENPDGSGAKVAQLHAQSQGLHIIGEPNEHGYVLVEAFSNYDEEYNPKTDEEKAHAFDVKQGYVLAEHLKTVDVRTDIAFVVDKLTQRMYMFIDGVRVTEFLIATGKITDEKYYNETIAGEYITISHTGGFESGNMYCDMAIRINGGILLHEVPHKVNADGSKNYASFEAYLGTKQSHGCIRIQRLKTPEGYNHRWIWENLNRKGGHKVIIWDDLNRYDTPTTWQENP